MSNNNVIIKEQETSKTSNRNIYHALIDARKNMPKIIKDSLNPFFNSKYTELADILAPAQEYLFQHGLWLSWKSSIEHLDILEVIITYADTGETNSTFVPLIGIFEPLETNEKGNKKITVMQRYGSTVTYAARYGACSILAISPAKDEDGNNTSNSYSASSSSYSQRVPPPLAPSTKGMPFSKSLPPISPKVVNESSDDLIEEIVHIWSLKKEICRNQDPLRAERAEKYISDNFMGVPKENLLILRNYLRELKEKITDKPENISLEDSMKDLVS